MEVIEAKQGFLSWNEKNFDDYLSRLDPEQKSALKILPLLFQTNDRLLPGYSGPDAPAGIYGYLPNTSVINEAKTFHDKFRYNQERPLKITIIESIYLQHNVLNDEMNLWVLHVEKLRPEQLSDLRDKCEKIKTWLLSRNVHVSTSVSTVKRLLKKTSPPAIFLDSFYFQSYLLAGKYPVWWLVPPEKENDYDAFVDHIITAKFVNSQEFLNLGRLGGLNHDDVLKLAIKHARNVYKSPELSFLELLLLMRKQRVLPEVDGVASVIKKKIYSNKKNYDEYSTHNVVADVLIKELEVLSQERTENKNPVVSHFKMFGLLSCYSNTASRKMLKTLSGDYKVSTRDIGVSEYLDFNKVLFSEVGEVYALLLDKCNAKNKADNKDSKLASLSNNMRSFLSKGESRVPVFITQNKTEFILDRMLLKHNIENDISDSWSLIMQMNEGEEKTISVFNDLISLIIWAWLNRVADRSTQISISCPKLLVKQTEAFYVLEMLADNVDPGIVANINDRVFDRPNRPLRSFLFFNLMADEHQRQQIKSITRSDDPLSFGDASENLFANCEQLVMNAWGDVYTQHYSGADGVLQCLCDWTHHASLSPNKLPQELKFFGYGSGESTLMAQRIDQVYDEIIQFFYQDKHVDGALIIRMGDAYYSVFYGEQGLQQKRVGKKQILYPYFESENKMFKPYMLERLAMSDSPLREIFKKNKADVIQIFFHSRMNSCETWVLDEKGSLCHIQQNSFDRPGYIAHWLYVMRNIRNRLKKINYQDKELPLLEIFEISNNRLGGVDFHPVGSEDISTGWGFIDVKVVVKGDGVTEKVSLICEDKHFDYDTYGDKVVPEAVQHISAKLAGEGMKSVYVTDIDAPLRLYGVDDREDIQVMHFLKYMRNIETMLNKLLRG